MPRLRVSFVRLGREPADPLAVQIMESLRNSTESLRYAAKLVTELQAELAGFREESLAYFLRSRNRTRRLPSWRGCERKRFEAEKAGSSPGQTLLD
jgi:hypothetical protein